MSKLKSRKFVLAVATAVLTVLNDGLGFGLPKDTILMVVGVVAAYIVGESAVDAASAASGNKQ